MKRILLIILTLLFCSIGIIAQTSYYYYKGTKIPLVVNTDKVCINIPKNITRYCNALITNAKVLDKIVDTDYEISIIQQSDIKILSSILKLKEKYSSVLVSQCFITQEGMEVYSTPYINIRLKQEEDINKLVSFADKYSLKILKQDTFLPLWYILSITPETGNTAVEIANRIWESGVFEASVPDLCSKELICSNDPLYSQQWGLQNNTYPGIDISISQAWNYATGKNIKIAIVDTGIDMNHIDLSSNIAGLSYDTETGTSPSLVYGDHATHCAGIAAAVKDNNIHIAGVAPEATLLSISNSLTTATTNLQLKLADGLCWAYQHGADIISNSWHSPYHSAIDEAIQNALTYGRNGRGCVIVFAAGNDNDIVNYPANCNEKIITVGAINNTGTRAFFSNYGTVLDIMAPGVDIISTLPNNQAGIKSGTSMSCPHVAGVAALVLERNTDLSVNQVNSIICGNAKKLSGVNFNMIKPDGSWNIEYGYGLVDAYSSVINTSHVVYIQNETITGTNNITSDRIYIGKDVANYKTNGDVILGQGNNTLKANYIEIKNSTTIPLGTTLTIKN